MKTNEDEAPYFDPRCNIFCQERSPDLKQVLGTASLTAPWVGYHPAPLGICILVELVDSDTKGQQQLHLNISDHRPHQGKQQPAAPGVWRSHSELLVREKDLQITAQASADKNTEPAGAIR